MSAWIAGRGLINPTEQPRVRTAWSMSLDSSRGGFCLRLTIEDSACGSSSPTRSEGEDWENGWRSLPCRAASRLKG